VQIRKLNKKTRWGRREEEDEKGEEKDIRWRDGNGKRENETQMKRWTKRMRGRIV
jgi:hypothetical protein